ncbi:MAG: hypothetical protein Q8M76_04070, partial [Spirochaetaceae bacterium]|nr:hypothetical protein [Spirochaetaceae bacterium]
VDNKVPVVTFNDPPVLSPVNGIYSFNGTAAEEAGDPMGTYRYRVYGNAVDSGVVSGIASVEVFFAKDVGGTWYVYAPQGIVRASQLVSGRIYVILSAGTTSYLGLGASSNAAGTEFTATATGTGTGSGLVIAKDAPIKPKSVGVTEPTSPPTADIVAAGSFEPGVRYRITSLGAGTSWTALGADATPAVGEYFIATGIGTGSGTASLEYSILIDERTEFGTNDDNENGDYDGIQESLRAKTGDEWFADFNTRVFPDGPLSVHFIARDEAGNFAEDSIDGQIVNNPPSIGTLSFNGFAAPSNLRVKYGGNVTFIMASADAGAGASIDAATYKLTVTNKYANTGGAPGAEDGGFSSFYYGVDAGGSWIVDFLPKTGGAEGSATLDIDTVNDGFVTNNWYLLRSEVKDADENVAYKYFYLLVNNADNNRPVVKTSALAADQFNDFTQANLIAGSGHIEDPASIQYAGTVTTATDASTISAAALVNNPFIGAGWTVTDTTLGETRTISAFTPLSGQIVVSAAFGTAPSLADALVVKNPALLSGSVKVMGKVYDDTDVGTVTVRISTDGGSIFSDLGAATKSNQTGNLVDGFTYDWEYAWDTSTVSGVARSNVVIGVYATDAVGYGTLATKNVDVVPYITSIADSTGLSADVLRGATGKYSIAAHGTNTLTVNGYN